MKYGACSWTFGDEPLADTAARLASFGFEGLELLGDLGRYEPGHVSRVLNDHALAVLSLTPENVDLAHPDLAQRTAAVDYYYRLLDFAAALGNPVVCCHGAVGRVRAVSTCAEEWGYYVEGVRSVGRRAQGHGLRVAMEVLNRYEAHMLNTASEALRFVSEVGLENVGILLDAYHMNIEEADLRSAILAAGERLFLFHAADSNRQSVGRGHTDFLGVMRSLGDARYDGAVIVECTACGPDPFTPVKAPGWREEVARYAQESVRLLRLYEGITRGKGEASTCCSV
jgi:D-psicose/D-tagatose/L-ribulose 3-epimerase